MQRESWGEQQADSGIVSRLSLSLFRQNQEHRALLAASSFSKNANSECELNYQAM